MSFGILALINPEIRKGYWNTYHCQNRVFTVNGRVYGKYCKNRFCTLCCANRKADIINRYLPIVQIWEKPCLVTLTIKSVPYYRLNVVMKSMIKEFRAIVETYRKRNQRGKGIRLVGIRSLEINYNFKDETRPLNSFSKIISEGLPNASYTSL